MVWSGGCAFVFVVDVGPCLPAVPDLGPVTESCDRALLIPVVQAA